jgi:type IV secretory pathway component VirB8
VLNEGKNTHTVVFTCTVKNTATSAVVTKFTMTLTYQGSPA